MKTFKIYEDEFGLITEIRISSGEIFKTVQQLIEWSNTEQKVYGEGLHKLAVAVESVHKIRTTSYLKNGLSARVKIGKTTWVDVSGWNFDIDENPESLAKLEQIQAINDKIPSAPSVEVNEGFFRKMGYKEASKRTANAPTYLDGYMCSSKLNLKGFKPAYSGGILASPANPGKIYENVVSYDIASAYPYTALTTQVPTGKSYDLTKTQLKKIKVENGTINLEDGYGFIGLFKVIKMERKKWCKAPFIKIDLTDFTIQSEWDDKGMVYASEAVIAMSPADLKILDMQFDFKDIEIMAMTVHSLGPIPEAAAEYIKEAYIKKETATKGSPEREAAKTALNTIVGFWGSDPFASMKKRKTVDGVVREVYDGNAQEAFAKYTGTGEKNGFVAGHARTWDIRWATYVVAENRLRIVEAMKELYDNDIELLYVDTDSIKCVGDTEKIHEIFQEFNNRVLRTLNYKGVGLWQDESKNYSKAVFRGVKVYFTEDKYGNRFNTVAGIEKKQLEQFDILSLRKLSYPIPLEINIQRRCPAELDDDYFGARIQYALKTLKVEY